MHVDDTGPEAKSHVALPISTMLVILSLAVVLWELLTFRPRRIQVKAFEVGFHLPQIPPVHGSHGQRWPHQKARLSQLPQPALGRFRLLSFPEQT